MKIAVNFKVDVSKLDKSRLYKGAKGVYADMTAFIDIDEVGQYGDNGTISQQTSKEERDQGMKMPIIGNTTVFWRDDGQPVAKKVDGNAPQSQAPPQQMQPQAQQQQYQQQPVQQQQFTPPPIDDGDSIPF
jgi:hypothetical protein